MPNNSADNTFLLHCLSQLTLNPEKAEDELTYLSKLGYEERKHFESVGDSNHVVVRALQAAQLKTNDDASLATWIAEVIARQERRIGNALTFLRRICQKLENAGAMRLSLLPPLASAAAVAYRVTGSDKGIW